LLTDEDREAVLVELGILPLTPPTPNGLRNGLLPVYDAAELVTEMATAPEVRWLVSQVWPSDAYGVIAASWKAGKTWASLDLAVSVASGTDWLATYPIDTAGPVLVFLGEGGKRKMYRRLEAICQAKGVDLSSLPLRLCFRVPHLSDAEQLRALQSELAAHPPTLVIVDPLYLAARGAKASALYEMGAHLEVIQLACQASGSALVMVTHHNRDRNATGSGRMTGAGPAEWGRILVNMTVVTKSSRDGASDVVLEVEMEGDEIPDTKARFRRHVRAEDPADLSSPLVYEVSRVAEDEPAEGMRPSDSRIVAVLAGLTGPLTVKGIGDHLAIDGRPLKARTIQDSLDRLEGMLLVDGDGAKPPTPGRWWLTEAGRRMAHGSGAQ
jgi:AAA domain-containing protein